MGTMPKRVTVLCVYFLCLVQVCWSNSVVESLKCHMPNSTTLWESNPEMKTVDVEWKYGTNSTCHTSMECYGVKNVTANGDLTTSVEVQLHPVQLQNGNKLRFQFRRYLNTTYPYVYKVNATGFSTCNVSSGRIVRRDNGSDVFDVPSEFLDVGNNYFVVATNYSVFIACELGLRLNVTVKAENCTGNGTGVCGGRGMCVTNKHQDNFACHCCGTYKGENCSVFDVCLSEPCQNGGECLHGNSSTKNLTGGYECKCAIGFNGTNCENKTQNLCDLVQCQNGGTCYGNATSFNCTCIPGWEGRQCEVDINDCETVPCRHGYCRDRLNGYNCTCYPGYYGETCDYKRTSCKFSPCQNGGFCENRTTSTEFKFACYCPPGWNGTDCSQRVSPCEPNPCTNQALCMEEYNGFRCACQPGYTGHHCEMNINDCEPNPCLQGGQCYDLEQGHVCKCVQGHYGTNCQYTISERGYFPAIETHVTVINEDKGHHQSLSMVAGVLTAVVVIGVLLLVGVYCLKKDSSKRMCGLRGIFRGKPSSDLTVHVNVANTPDCPLTSDAFFQGSKPQLDIGLDNKAFNSELV